jgi:signal transduction histidine kinase
MKNFLGLFGTDYLRRPEIWGARLFIFMGFMACLLSFATDVLRLNNDSILWALIQILTLSVYICMALVFRAVFFVTPKSPRAALTANLVAAAILGAIHNVLVAYLATALGLDPHLMIWKRIIGGALFGAGLFTAYGFAFNDQLRRKDLLAQMIARRAELKNFVENARQIVVDEFDEQANQIRSTLLPKLDFVQNLMKERNSSQDTVRLLRYLVQAEVRPLSHDLSHQQGKQLVAASKTIAEGQANIGAKYSFSKTLYPFSFFVSLVFTMSLADDVSVEIREVNALVLSFLASAFLLAVRYLTRGLNPVKDSKVIAYLASLAIVLSGFGWVVTSALGEPHAFAMVTYYSIAVIASLYLNSAFSLMAQYRGQLHAELDKTNQKLARAITRLKQNLWLSRRQLVSQLHGTVQGAITAAVTRLANAAPNDQKALALAQEDLDRAVAALQQGAEHELDLIESLSGLQVSWQGVCDFSWRVSRSDLDLIELNPNNAFYIAAITTEAISNAIRHGGATKVHLDLATQDGWNLLLEISNDGTPPPPEIASGTGTKLISELSSSWRFEQQNGLNVLKLQLPLVDEIFTAEELATLEPVSSNGGGRLLKPSQNRNR